MTNSNNYHWTYADISHFTKEFLTKEFKENNFLINKFHCEATITQRMGDVGFNYLFNIELVDNKNNKKIIFENFDEYVDLNIFEPEYIPIFKQILFNWKKAALVRRGDAVLEPIVQQKTDDEIILKAPKLDDICAEANLEVNKNYFFIKIGCKADRLRELMFLPEYNRIWTFNQYLKDNDTIKISNMLFLKNLEENDTKLKFKMKLANWKSYADVILRLVEDNDITTAKFYTENAEINSDIGLKRLWCDLVFNKIAQAFGLRLF